MHICFPNPHPSDTFSFMNKILIDGWVSVEPWSGTLSTLLQVALHQAHCFSILGLCVHTRDSFLPINSDIHYSPCHWAGEGWMKSRTGSRCWPHSCPSNLLKTLQGWRTCTFNPEARELDSWKKCKWMFLTIKAVPTELAVPQCSASQGHSVVPVPCS